MPGRTRVLAIAASTMGRIANALEVPVKTLFDGEYEPDGKNG
jgi:hypothetical protein